MSIIGGSDNVVIISHDLFLQNVYRTVIFNSGNVSYRFKDCYFNITQPYKQKRSKKSNMKDGGELDNDARKICKIHELYKDMVSDCFSKLRQNMSVCDEDQRGEVCNLGGEFKGGNMTETCLVATVSNEPVLIPPQCRFFNYDVKEISKHVDEKFNVIVLDPPWWNKYIRRKRARNCDDA